jgi:hypothetical protein
MVWHFQHPDMDAHEPGCLEAEGGEPRVEPNSAYIDVFCACHHYTEPKILMNGTDVAWPAGWSQEQANVWRSEHGLGPPVGEKVSVGEAMAQADTQDNTELVNPIAPPKTMGMFSPSVKTDEPVNRQIR